MNRLLQLFVCGPASLVWCSSFGVLFLWRPLFQRHFSVGDVVDCFLGRGLVSLHP